MLTTLKNILRYLRGPLEALRARNDKLQLAGFAIAIISVWLVNNQLRENNKTNRVSIRGQLYEREAAMAEDEATDEARKFATLWANAPPQTPTGERARLLLRLVTEDEAALSARSAAELHHSMYDVAVFADEGRRDRTQNLRRLFGYTQTTYYHVHNTFDYQRDGIITHAELRTWKGLIRETRAHPMLLAVIWHSHRNNYISRPFAQFLQAELCPDEIPADVADAEEFKRDREFVRSFYPEMTRADWPDKLPDY